MLTKAKIELVKSLKAKKERSKHGLFIVEGWKSICDLLKSSFEIEEIFLLETEKSKIHQFYPQQKVILVSEIEMKKCSFLTQPPAVLAIVRIPTRQIQWHDFGEKLTLVLDGVQDPGNLGTIIRTAHWFNIETIICSTDTVDVFNPKTIQASMGSVFFVNVYYGDLNKYILKLKEINLASNWKIYGAFINGQSIYDGHLTQNGVIIIGNEGHGISKELEVEVDIKISIPCFSAIQTFKNAPDSLNAAVSSALICSEFRRRSQ